MKKAILFTMTLSCIFFYNCKNTDKQQVTEKSNEKESILIVEPQKTFDAVQPSKVITYREIEQYLQSIKAYQYYDEYSTKEKAMNRLFSELSDYFQNMLCSELRLLRNEFFARKGYIFKSSDLNEYFLSQSWYNPIYTSIDSIILNNEQQQVVDSILFYEQKNTALTNKLLANNALQLLRDSKWEQYWDCYKTDFPIAMFRRNIGYLLIDKDNVEESEKEMYMYMYDHTLLLIDTISINKDVLVMGFIRQTDCPNEYCLYGGVLFTCDMSFKNVIDFRRCTFENLRKERQRTMLLCSFEMPIEFGGETSYILIDSTGRITDYIEDSLQ